MTATTQDQINPRVKEAGVAVEIAKLQVQRAAALGSPFRSPVPSLGQILRDFLDGQRELTDRLGELVDDLVARATDAAGLLPDALSVHVRRADMLLHDVLPHDASPSLDVVVAAPTVEGPGRLSAAAPGPGGPAGGGLLSGGRPLPTVTAGYVWPDC